MPKQDLDYSVFCRGTRLGTRFSWPYLIRCDSLILSDDAGQRMKKPGSCPGFGNADFASSSKLIQRMKRLGKMEAIMCRNRDLI